jgi:hypothetical protein
VHIRTDFAEVLRRHMILLLGAMAVPYFCTFAVLAGIGVAVRTVMHWFGPPQPIDPRELWNSFGLLPKLGVILVFCLSALSPYAVGMAGVTLITWEDRLAKTPTAGQVAVGIWPLVPRLLVLGSLTGLGTLFGSFLLVIPGILFAAFTAFAVPSLVIDKMNVPKALSRSIKLTKPEIATLGGLYLLVFGLTYILQDFATLVLTRSIALAVSMLLFGALVIHVCEGVLITLFYCQARSTLDEHASGLIEG